MKKKISLITILFLSIILIGGCRKSKDGNLTITVFPNTDDLIKVKTGETYEFYFTISPNKEIKSKVGDFVIFEEDTAIFDTVFNSSKEITFKFIYTVPIDKKNGDYINFTAIGTDKVSNNKTIVNFEVLIEEDGVTQSKLTMSISPSSPSFLIVNPGKSYNFNINIEPDVANYGKVGHFVITEGSTLLVDTIYDSETAINYDFNYTVNSNANDSEFINLSFIAIDANSGKITNLDLELIVNEETVSTSELDISISPNPDTTMTVFAGESYDLNITITPDVNNGGKVGHFVIAEGSDVLVDTTYASTNTVTYVYTYMVPADAAVDSEIDLTIEATDAVSGQMTVATFSMVVGAPAFPEVLSWTGSLKYTSTTLSDNFLLVCGTDGAVETDGNSTEGDLAFVWQNFYGYSVVSPNAGWIAELYSYNNITYSTSDKKETKIMTYSGAWEDLTDEAIAELTVDTESVVGGGNGVQNLTEGSIIVFETADGRKGAFKVTSNAKVTMNMSGEAKFQKEANSAK